MKLWKVTNGRGWKEWQFEGFDMTPTIFVMKETSEEAIEEARKVILAAREEYVSDDLVEGEREKKEKMIDMELTDENENQITDWYSRCMHWPNDLKAEEIESECTDLIAVW